MRGKNDERTGMIKNKATSGGFLIFSFGLIAVLLYRQYYLGQELSQYADIFAVWLLGNAYVALSSVLKGVQPFDGMKRSKFLVPAIIAVTVVIVMALQEKGFTFSGLLISFLVAFTGSYIVLWVLWKLYYLWENKNL